MSPLSKYLGLFVSEAADHLEKAGAGLVRLESVAREGGAVAPLVDELFRHAHSVKGMAAAMELAGIAGLAHTVEDLVSLFRGAGTAPDPGSVDVLLAAFDRLAAMVQESSAGGSPAADEALLARVRSAVAEARARVGDAPFPGRHVRDFGPVPAAAAPEASPSPPVPAAERGTAPATASPGAPPGDAPAPAPGATPTAPRRVAVEVQVAATCPVPAVRAFLVLKKLERVGNVQRSSPTEEDLRAGRLPARRLEVTLQTGEALGTVERALSQISDLQTIDVRDELPPSAAPPLAVVAAVSSAAAVARDGARTVRVRVDVLDSFLDAVGELILATARLREVGRGIPEAHRPPLDEGVDRLHATVKDLHDKVMTVRMTPLAVVTERLPRAARDLARRTGKQVEVEVQGAEIELDRAILDELADPLLHVLRNAVDHGIERPPDRERAGKPPTGRVTVSARRERDRVLVEVADDGEGMDPQALRAAAVARGAIGEAAARELGDREALLLACLPGVSTARQLSDVSGRGVGMDAVKRTVEALGGAIDVESKRGGGTRWILRLPLTVAVQPVLLVGVGDEVLGLPVSKVHGAAQVDVAALDRSQGAPMLLYGGKLLPVRELGTLLGFAAGEGPAPGQRRGARSVVVTDSEGSPVGLAVDALLGQHEAVLKPLARPFDQVPGLSALTVLASGRPVFVLDVPRLLAP